MRNDWSSHKVFVFTPYRMTPQGPESITYGTAEFKAEVAGWMQALKVDHIWVEVTPETSVAEIEKAIDESRRRPVVIFNLCDGIEVDGYPGVKTVRQL